MLAQNKRHTLNPHLKKIIKELKSIELLEFHVLQLQEAKSQSQIRLNELSNELEVKNAKIDRLDSINFKTIYLKLTGNLDLRLELYQNHFLELALEHKEVVKSIEIIDYEIEIITSKLKDLEQVKATFQEKVKTYKERALNIELVEYRNTINKIEHYLRLSQELKEAIKEGSSVNRKFNAIIKLIKEVAREVYDKKINNIEELNEYKVREIEKYQDGIISINHAFFKYVGELNDVYKIILNSSDSPDKLLENFMNHYRFNLVNDLRKAENLKSSFKFLQRYKNTVLSLNRTLRKDLKSISKYIEELELKEEKLLKKISKKV